MSNPLDTDAGSELFSSYEAELKLVQADLNQKLEQIPELTGEPRKSAIRQAERALEEANELVCRKLRFHLAEFVSRNPPVGW
jgi:vesicle transport through interaction with t-SNAREs 1